ncbi:phosphatidylinositol glycan anchor biosynthesis class O isoform X2 [Xylocopa sonorina]|uniref:phosphatidylinositol glycan anchor biosynthesis class O isoform X2 n=1 Tax=Xylocopa sonorina TaxID=1818115 RepID=UPI00403AAAB8
MSKLWNYLIFHGWMSYLMTAGLLIFTSGFLLNRVARPERAECKYCTDSDCNIKQLLQKPDVAAITCFERKTRIVLLVVDALKYDFAHWHSDNSSISPYYHNKLPIIHELLQNQPMNSRLYKFIADPPTTTMQRLKGITTGSLPTFIDIGSNFASESINEDNIVDQNAARGIVFMGDDTWTNLFPGKFKRQFPSASFNVWDLDSVDKDVRYRIFFEMKKKDWSLLIAHVLGIDHCGHKHGANHPEMTRKLNDTNTLIKEVIESLEEDTVLFIVGDHGMTDSGDHGGDSNNEIEAAMFVYSMTPLVKYDSPNNIVNQIDLVPTLASILGIPIPFSNLGSIILGSFPSSIKNGKLEDDYWYMLHSMWRNIAQTKKYIDVYSADSYLFSKEQLKSLENMYDRLLEQIKSINTIKEFESFFMNSQNYYKLLKDTCSEVWVQFDSSLMSKGLLLMFCALFFFYLFITGIPDNHMSKIFESSFLQCSILANLNVVLIIFLLFFLNILEELKNTILFATGAVSIVLLMILIVKNWNIISMRWYSYTGAKKLFYIAKIVFLLTICCLFSNSYIVEESSVLSFFLITLLLLLVFNLKRESTNENLERKTKPFLKSQTKSNSKTIIIAIGLIACISIRLSYYFWRCREEQQRVCSYIIGKTGSLASDNLERILLAITLIILALYITIIRLWLQNCGNLSGFSPSVLVGQYCPVIIGVCTGCYWVLQRLPKFVKVKFALSWQINTLPNIVYILSLLAIFVLYYRPLSIFLLSKKKESINVYHDQNVIPRLFEKIKESIYRKNIDIDETPVVYGLGTAYSATFVSLSAFLMLLYSLLLGDILSPSTFLMFISCATILGLSAVERYRNANNVSELVEVPIPVLLCWFLVAEYFFYGTGHQPTFPTIHWDAAFVGTGGHFYGNLLPAILIAKVKFSEDIMKRGELLLFEQDSVFHAAIFSVAGRYTLLHGIRTFGSMLAATIHCRHLMVWKIFAPKLIFEGLGLLVTLSSVLASFYMVFRIDRQIEHLISKVIKDR